MHGTCFKITVKVVSADAKQACWGGGGKFLLVLNLLAPELFFF